MPHQHASYSLEASSRARQPATLSACRNSICPICMSHEHASSATSSRPVSPSITMPQPLSPSPALYASAAPNSLRKALGCGPVTTSRSGPSLITPHPACHIFGLRGGRGPEGGHQGGRGGSRLDSPSLKSREGILPPHLFTRPHCRTFPNTTDHRHTASPSL